MKNYSFLTGGKIQEIYVEEGAEVKAGSPLAKLDTVSQKVSLNTARANVDSLKMAVDTAKSALNASNELHLGGYISDKDWEKQESEYSRLYASYITASDTLKQMTKNLEESTIYAMEDGFVMDTFYKPGEVVGAGVPIVTIKSSQTVITIGISSSDILSVKEESLVLVDGKIEAQIDSIGQYPDEKTKAFPVDVAFESEQYVIGDMAEIKIITGVEKGHFVPIQSVFSIEGLDYVYTVNDDDLVLRKQVFNGELRDDLIEVEGLEDGMQVICSGIKSIKENEKVIAVAPTVALENGGGLTDKKGADNK